MNPESRSHHFWIPRCAIAHLRFVPNGARRNDCGTKRQKQDAERGVKMRSFPASPAARRPAFRKFLELSGASAPGIVGASGRDTKKIIASGPWRLTSAKLCLEFSSMSSRPWCREHNDRLLKYRQAGSHGILSTRRPVMVIMGPGAGTTSDCHHRGEARPSPGPAGHDRCRCVKADRLYTGFPA